MSIDSRASRSSIDEAAAPDVAETEPGRAISRSGGGLSGLIAGVVGIFRGRGADSAAVARVDDALRSSARLGGPAELGPKQREREEPESGPAAPPPGPVVTNLPRVDLTDDGKVADCNASFRDRFVDTPSASAEEPSRPTGREPALVRVRIAAARALEPFSRDGRPRSIGTLDDLDGDRHLLTLCRAGEALAVIATPAPPASIDDDGLGPYLEASDVGVLGLNEGGSVVTVNAAGARLLEKAGSPAKGARFEELLPADARQALAAEMAGAVAGRVAGEAVEFELEGTEKLYLSADVRPLPSGTPGGARAAVFLTDISRARSLEQQFVQSQRMQAVGQLAGGIAHDFNNLLTAMTGYCDLLLVRHRPGDQSFADIMQIRQNVNRAANLVRQLLAFSRQQTLIPKVLDVTDTLADLSHLLRRLIGESMRLSITHGRDIWTIKVDQGQFEQLIVNLVVNARDAMSDGGTVAMRTYNVTVDQARQQGDQSMTSGRYVLIEVADTGSGIPPEFIDRIFEPFFSTKPVGAGTGLGLATVYGIVKQAGGSIFVDSMPDQGTTFSIYLPAYEGDEVPMHRDPSEADRMNEDLTGEGTILLVEDEDPVRLFSARALRSKGYRVIEARSGEAALAQVEEGAEQIDLIVTDVVMPGMDGPTLVRRLREKLGDLRVVCISGYTEEDVRQRIAEDTSIRFLSKPFSLRQLAAVVKDTISS